MYIDNDLIPLPLNLALGLVFIAIALIKLTERLERRRDLTMRSRLMVQLLACSPLVAACAILITFVIANHSPV